MIFKTLMLVLMAVLPPCESEDSTNCAWDASVQGNGTGNSFVDFGGHFYVFNFDRE